MATDWAQVDAEVYFDWHVEFGNTVTFCQAYIFGGTALYPSKLCPVAPGKGSPLLPRLYKLSRADMQGSWSVRLITPETPWTELLCAGIEEFLAAYPVEWLLFDWFVYSC